MLPPAVAIVPPVTVLLLPPITAFPSFPALPIAPALFSVPVSVPVVLAVTKIAVIPTPVVAFPVVPAVFPGLLVISSVRAPIPPVAPPCVLRVSLLGAAFCCSRCSNCPRGRAVTVPGAAPRVTAIAH